MADEISNSEDIIDVRNVIERVEELREMRDGDAEHFADGEEAELSALESLLGEMAGYGGDHQWEGQWYPVTLIRDDYFPTYAEELAADISNVKGAEWPFNCIDWQEAAEQLKVDYSCAEFDGVTYWYR